MLKKLFVDLFEKVKNEEENNSTTKNGISTYFAETLLDEKFNKPNFISAKAIKGYYEKYVEGKLNSSGEPKTELKNLISEYLGYNNFQEFNTMNKKKNRLNIKNLAYAVAIIVITSLTTLQFNNADPKPCVEWNTDHYEIIDCNNEYPNPILKDVDIDNFKKLIVTKNSVFYKYGKPIVWYGRSSNRKIDFFNSRGVHPETLKELKPITDYIIDKYVQ